MRQNTRSRRTQISDIKAREILDCRGNPTLQVDVETRGGMLGRADVPSGLSTGKYETVELRDRDHRYDGKGVRKAVEIVKTRIRKRLVGMDCTRQREIDQCMIELDGTENKSNLGGNSIVGVSLAACRAAANSLQTPVYSYLGGRKARILPVPFFNLINGGKHAGSYLDFQEHIIVPVGAKTFSDALRYGVEVYFALKKILIQKFGPLAINVGDEGGYEPPVKTCEEALDLIAQALDEAGYSKEFKFALDAAASHLYDPSTQNYRLEGHQIDSNTLLDYYKKLVSQYGIISIEDPFHQDDPENFARITKELSIQIVGDDFFTTNPKRIRTGINHKAGNALLWKVNQIGTLTEAIAAAQLASRNHFKIQVSERSGDTEDPMIADLAVALNAGQIKTGAPARGERTSKYNRLLQIEEELGSKAQYPGEKILLRES